MFPLDSHKGAREQCIAVICDDKSFADLHGGYRSENQCEEGAALVTETVAFLRQKGIGSTPTYIFPDGVPRSGLLNEEALRSRLGLPPAAASPSATEGEEAPGGKN